MGDIRAYNESTTQIFSEIAMDGSLNKTVARAANSKKNQKFMNYVIHERQAQVMAERASQAPETSYVDTVAFKREVALQQPKITSNGGPAWKKRSISKGTLDAYDADEKLADLLYDRRSLEESEKYGTPSSTSYLISTAKKNRV